MNISHSIKSSEKTNNEKILFRLYTKSRLALQREKNNTMFIHIYNINNSWVAFEKSVYFINRCIPQCSITAIKFDAYMEYGSLIFMADISEGMLRYLLYTYRVVTNKDGYKKLTTNYSLNPYAQWRKELSDDLLRDM